jgi:uncharacterized membrane protein YoaK (UPF0700 family)
VSADTSVLAQPLDHVPGEDTWLAAIAGYVDTLGFVALFGLFTAHVTGNFILIGSGLAGAWHGLLIKWLAFPAFVAGIVCVRVLNNRLLARGHGIRACALYVLQTALLAGFMAAGVLAAPVTDADAPMTIACGLLGAAAMGVQNAHGRLTARSVVANTVMTGNVTQAVIDAFDLLFSSGDAKARHRAHASVAHAAARRRVWARSGRRRGGLSARVVLGAAAAACRVVRARRAVAKDGRGADGSLNGNPIRAAIS